MKLKNKLTIFLIGILFQILLLNQVNATTVSGDAIYYVSTCVIDGEVFSGEVNGEIVVNGEVIENAILDGNGCPIDMDKTINSDTVYNGLVIKNGVTFTLNANLTVNGNVTIEDGGLLTHSASSNTNFNLNVSGTLEVKQGGKINMNGRGTSSLGAGSSSVGGTYGGYGISSSKSPYGNIYEPNEVGSYGRDSSGYRGGGLIKMTVSNLINNGSITANANNTSYGAGSGGGININVNNQLSGTGVYQANGGTASYGKNGGGGRIAIKYGVVDNFENLKSKISATGPGGAGEGTIYLKNLTSKKDLLIIKGDGGGLGTILLEGMTTYDDLIIENAYLNLNLESNFDNLIINNLGILSLNKKLSVSSNVNINNGGLLTHSAVSTSLFNLVVGGTLNIQSDGKINMTSKGKSSLGAGSSSVGGTYGGYGISSGKSIYGDVYNPIHVGSYGRDSTSYRGGGLVRMTVGNLINNGAILANGGNTSYGAGSGGSINIIVNSEISGTGLYQANGGSTSYGKHGGGGRIAIRYGSSSDIKQLKSNIAVKGPGNAGEGTIYLKNLSSNYELLLVKGDGGSTGVYLPGNQNNYNNILIENLATLIQNTTLSITSDATIESGGIITHSAGSSSNFNLNVSGTLKLEPGSKINMNGRGTSSLGAGSSSVGGTYGGYGISSSKSPYGNIYEPNEVGSYGRDSSGYRGGGLIKMTVGNLINNGNITANAYNTSYGAGSGGGININVNNQLSGTGVYQANGGTASYGKHGGGGRIAIKYGTVDNFENLKTQISATGPGGAGEGTIYLKNLTSKKDLLIIKGDGGGRGTILLEGMTTYDDFIIENAYLNLKLESNIYDLKVKNGGIIALNQKLNIGGNVKIYDGGNITHSVVGASLFNLDVSGNLEIQSGGKIDVSEKGISTTGASGTNGKGGTYGGYGVSSSKSIYGDVYNPINVGSYGRDSTSYRGGGLAKITTGYLINNGAILANGRNSSRGAGSGGSINIIVNNQISGTGTYKANGGYSSYGYHGGGGRIAIKYGDTDNLDDLKSQILVQGPSGAGEGTIFLKNLNSNYELLLIKGDGGSTGVYLPNDQNNYNNIIIENLATLIQNNSLNIISNATIESGGTITHSLGISSNFNLEVGGTLEIQNGGKINMNGKGKSGIGASGTNGRGGTYGGYGNSSSKSPYGNIYEPNDVGSYGRDSSNYRGGGLVKMTVGNLINNGSITANAYGTSRGAGSGGSVNIIVDEQISGDGIYQANGGTSSYGYPGGGGRVAIKYGAINDLESLKTKISATGPSSAGEGTIYLENLTSGYNVLLIKGDGGARGTRLLDGMTIFGDLIIENGVLKHNINANIENLTINNGGIIYLDNNLIVSGDAQIRNGGLISHSTVSESLFNLQVAGTLNIEEGGKIDVSSRGKSTLGASGTNGKGGTYGGYGVSSSKNPYGNTYNPSEVGSYGRDSSSYRGGGLVRITVGNLINNGSVLANAQNTSRGAGSGGGINITVSENISGEGIYQANGGNSSYGYRGGGGRIAIKYGTVDNLETLKSKTLAKGPYAAGEGTIYLKDMTTGIDYLLIKGDGTSSRYTGVGTSISDYYFDTIEVTNYAKLYKIGTQDIIGGNCITSLGGVIDSLINCDGQTSFRYHDLSATLKNYDITPREYEYIVQGPSEGGSFVGSNTGVINGNGTVSAKIKLTKLGNYKFIFNLYDGIGDNINIEGTSSKNVTVSNE